MKITFKKVTIEGFQSIGKETTLQLESQGFVMIKGKNNFDCKALSNGAGKTSIVEAICWCLFGKTSSGVSNVTNRYYNNGCFVKVTFKIDNEEYAITRASDHKKLKNSVKVIKNGTDDISCRLKSDTDKLIRDQILPFTQDIFLSTIFLSQGFSGRLSLLTPSARKERLEKLANIDASINRFKDQINSTKTIFNDKCTKLQQNLSYLQGQLDIYTYDKESIESLKANPSIDIPDIPVEQLQTKIHDLGNAMSDIRDEISKISSERSSIDSKAYKYKEHKKTLIANMKGLEAKLSSINEKSECPTCHQILSNGISEDLINQFTTEKQENFEAYQKSDKFEKACIEKSTELQNRIEPLEKKHQVLRNMVDKTEALLQQYHSAVKRNSDIQSKLSRLSECVSKISEITGEVEKLKTLYEATYKQYEISDHMLKLITKEFRSYLLQDVVSRMNSKLAEYSKELFENSEDVIQLSTDDTKMNILLGQNLYETLSGGEKKKVDLALVLAQRDIALRISGFSCSILILDEILENMDATASNVSLSLLNQVSDEVESLFIISHNDYSIPVDSTILVTKGPDRISNITIS